MNEDPETVGLGVPVRRSKVLVTDASTATGLTLVKSLVQAGGDTVWAGFSEDRSPEVARDLPDVTFVRLDLANQQSVLDLAGRIGADLDILINTAEFRPSRQVGASAETARAEMDIVYFGLIRLIEAFAPPMVKRATDGYSTAMAWVNLLSISAIAGQPDQPAYNAAKAAALALSQSLRANLRQAGIRVVNAFPGPVDEEWNHHLAGPKLAPRALAAELIPALERGVEDIYPGEIAKNLNTRWRVNAKLLERDLSEA